MVWGTFTITHILSLLLGAAITIGLYFALKHRTEKTQTIVLGILSFAGIAAIIFNLVVWDSPIEYLPLHLCSLNAMLLPIVVFTRNKHLGNLLILFKLKLIKLDKKCIWSTVAITLGAYIAIHFINVFINQYCIANNILDWAGEVVQVNYMFSIFHEGNPLLKLFYDIIPYQFWYMLLCIPVAVVYLSAIYALTRYIKGSLRQKRREKKKIKYNQMGLSH